MEKHYLHFNAAALVDAAQGYKAHLAKGRKMMVTLAGAMSTAELGKIFAEMIRQGKVDIISCTGANLEEDVMNLVAHDHYERVPHYRDLTPAQERDLLDRGMNRVTDTCIPEHEAFRRLEKHVVDLWTADDKSGNRRFPHEYFYEMIRSGVLEQYYQIDPKDSWMVAAAERNLPIICPGWEDSTLGNIFAGHCIVGDCKPGMMKSGIEYMMFLADWYTNNCGPDGIGFFQIGGGSPVTSPFVWCPCYIRTCSVRASRSGAISARSAIVPPATEAIVAPFPMRRSPGASWISTRPNSSLKVTLLSWRPSSLPTSSICEHPSPCNA